jgi:hypothetical protein
MEGVVELVWDNKSPCPISQCLNDRHKISDIPYIDSPGITLPEHFPKDFCFGIRKQGKNREMAWYWRVVVPGTRMSAEAVLYAVDDHLGTRRTRPSVTSQ